MPHHILVVDDDADIRGLIHVALEMEGYEVSLAKNGQEAVDRIAENRPDLVLLDLQMPVMSGQQVLEWLRTAQVRIPVVFMSAGYRVSLEAGTHGADAYLAKPFDLDDVVHTVQRLTGKEPT